MVRDQTWRLTDRLVAALGSRAQEAPEGSRDRDLLRAAGDAIMAMRTDMPAGIADPDYARAFTLIRGVAWQRGYAALPHGSYTRDFDVCLVPWGDKALVRGVMTEHLFATLTETLEPYWRRLDEEPKDRGHGRLAVSYISRLEWGDNRYLDVSVFPGHPIDLA